MKADENGSVLIPAWQAASKRESRGFAGWRRDHGRCHPTRPGPARHAARGTHRGHV